MGLNGVNSWDKFTVRHKPLNLFRKRVYMDDSEEALRLTGLRRPLRTFLVLIRTQIQLL